MVTVVMVMWLTPPPGTAEAWIVVTTTPALARPTSEPWWTDPSTRALAPLTETPPTWGHCRPSPLDAPPLPHLPSPGDPHLTNQLAWPYLLKGKPWHFLFHSLCYLPGICHIMGEIVCKFHLQRPEKQLVSIVSILHLDQRVLLAVS